MMILDDVQWADHPSLDAISFALRRLRDTRLVVLMVVRDVADPGLPARFRRLFHADGTVHVPVPGLDAGAVAELCARLTGHRPTRRAALRFRRHTGGNPLHIRSLLTQLSGEALEDLGVPLPAPASLTVRVLADLAACGQAGSDLVAAAAVLGERSPLYAAADVARVDDPLGALEQAMAAGLLREEISTGELSFPCPLVRAAVYQEYLGPSRRAALHLRAATLAQDPAVALWHRGLGAVGPDRELAAELAGLGRRRASQGAWAEAVAHLAAATRLAPTAHERHRLVLEAAEARIIMGDAHPSALLAQVSALPASAWRAYVLALLKLEAGRTHEAAALLEDAWHHAPDATLAGKAAAQTALLRLLDGDGPGSAEWSARAHAQSPHPTTFDLTRCLSLYVADVLSGLGRLPAPASASGDELEALLGRARLRIWLDDLDGAVRDLDGLLAAVTPLPLRTRLLAYAALAEAEYRRGAWDSALAHCDAADALAVDAGHTLLAPLCHAIAVLVLAGRGEWEAAEIRLRSARATESALLRAHAAAAAVHLATARGDHEAAIASAPADHAPHESVIVPGPADHAPAKGVPHEPAIASGQADHACHEPALASGQADHAPAEGVPHEGAIVCGTVGHEDHEAVVILGPSASREACGVPPPGGSAEGLSVSAELAFWPVGGGSLPWEDLLVDALVMAGRVDEAVLRLRRSEKRGAGRPSRLAAASRARGNLHAARREPERAKAAYERSLELLDVLGTPFPLGLAELDYGAFLRRQGKRALAADHLERAHAALVELRARPYVERCSRELAACGVGHASRTEGPAQPALTTQEYAIAQHAARGLTNRQIARELALSVKTVEYHLGHIYLKLGIRSRAQLAVQLTQS
ncbi:helix-turn-helix transcriptional regulator [Nonomuraea sp. K274]|uniref:Helix-turn-helix transcriptional regulator n=1 Tax=Nonomuraea cypriaca TaxID=1187855 RepID=A0A931F7N1_9ACTN|nr:helix-turn-helix transcriptional regulator [Nonomuraea cypriaca]